MGKTLLHTPEGVRDIYGEEYGKRLVLQGKLHDALKRFGYHDIQTPTFEFFDVFSSRIGTIPSRELYKFFDKEGDTLVLRPDFTPSVARAAAKYFMEESLPLRFCYQGNTYSNASSLQGRLKELTQLGAELIGDDSVEADAELIAMAIECMEASGIRDFQVSIGEVGFFKGICEEAGIDEETERTLREYLSNKNYFAVEEILSTLPLKEEIRRAVLGIAGMFGSAEEIAGAGNLVSNSLSLSSIERLLKLHHVLSLYGADSRVTYDLSLLSKYNYYTGVIFRVYTYGVGDAVIKGGRYDCLLQEFGKQSPAIGFAIVVDELYSAVTRQKIALKPVCDGSILLYPPSMLEQAVAYAKELRRAGKRVELMREPEDFTPEPFVRYASQNQVGEIIRLSTKEHLKISGPAELSGADSIDQKGEDGQ